MGKKRLLIFCICLFASSATADLQDWRHRASRAVKRVKAALWPSPEDLCEDLVQQPRLQYAKLQDVYASARGRGAEFDPKVWDSLKEQAIGDWFEPPSVPGLKIRFKMYAAYGKSSVIHLSLMGLGNTLEWTAENSQLIRESRHHAHVVVPEMRAQGLTWIDELVRTKSKTMSVTADLEQQLLILSDLIAHIRSPRFLRANGITANPVINISGLSYGGWLMMAFVQDPRYRQLLNGGDIIPMASGGESSFELETPALARARNRAVSMLDFFSLIPVVDMIVNQTDRSAFEAALNHVEEFKNDDALRMSAVALFFGIKSYSAFERFSQISSDSRLRYVIAENDVVLSKKLTQAYVMAILAREVQSPGQSQIIFVEDTAHDIHRHIMPRSAQGLAWLLHTEQTTPFAVIVRSDGNWIASTPEEILKRIR